MNPTKTQTTTPAKTGADTEPGATSATEPTTEPGATSDTAPGTTSATEPDTAPGATEPDTAPGATEPDTAPGATEPDTAPGATEAGDEPEHQEPHESPELHEPEGAGEEPATGLAAAAAAVVATALGIASLTGTWMGRVASERETLIGQITTSRTGTPAQQISEIYGDAWHTTALVNGLFAVIALITGLLVLTRPQRPLWVRAVGLAGAVLGALGLLLSAGMYADLFLPLPTTGS
ncbi:hypothetical protein E2C02_05585 [Streptomyces sp. WAC05374]|uniref:hypothetical protein n=1 Tax=Streptomyces sp. WAC05374 TaxID=2487420 RepID=UPI000F873945|nr:hypothetical protein [Streptomyces sp. WAC05374]RST04730.1 hypothetical protein EF905_33580 [Streptomyces sp. WAC05374]TDF40233.1 hypothetical protein E2B92_25455 [Streptomyces sp. WAC05374]TDF59270.1 hypothetical protein E2C02_05585 [Streptomyces sp. WAC05374]